MVEKTGEGSRPWNKKEKDQLLEKGKVKGYEGHHIDSVKANPEKAADPSNVEFVKGRKEHLDKHGGNFKNPTTGKPIDRSVGD